MSDDADHEVIDSPEALFRHLDEAHGLAEARDLDPLTAPVQFWLRRHAELERAERLEQRARERAAAPGGDRTVREPPERARQERPERARRAPPGRAGAPPESRPEAPRHPRRRPAGPEGAGRARYDDPIVEAVVLALAERGYDERGVRAFVASYVGPDGRRTGADGLRAAFVAPMLDAIAERLPRTAPAAPAAPAGRASRADERDDDVMAIADAVQRRGGGRPSRAEPRRAAYPDDDVMAIADVLQRRRAGRGRA